MLSNAEHQKLHQVHMSIGIFPLDSDLRASTVDGLRGVASGHGKAVDARSAVPEVPFSIL